MNVHLSSALAEYLLKEQENSWELAKHNFGALHHVRVREFKFDHFVIKVQLNPARILSSLAQIDPLSIEKRECFLCSSHRSDQQQALPFCENYQLMVNPYPIFPKHLTIPSREHKAQRIEYSFKDMLEMARQLDRYVIFYNGPRSGASAPDHLHFQAGNKGFLPLERDLKNLPHSQILFRRHLSVYSLDNYLRTLWVLEFTDPQEAVVIFREIYYFLYCRQENKEEEPMMNLITWYETGKWTVCLFPRALHRPSFYTEQGKEHLLISPGAVDMGGVIITPREEDFEKITAKQVQQIFSEVCLKNESLSLLFGDMNKNSYV